jgi:hypothetical protein
MQTEADETGMVAIKTGVSFEKRFLHGVITMERWFTEDFKCSAFASG